MKCTSRCVTSTSALVPENPVRYRTLGKLVRTNASMCAAIKDSRSAAMRAGRRSPIGGDRQTLHEASQRQLVTIGAESADYSKRGISQGRAATFRLTRVDVGEMYLHERDTDPGERVMYRETGVGVSAGIHERAIGLAAQRLHC